MAERLTPAWRGGWAAGDPICIAGPTACGKSAVAMALARSLPGEILSVDSMQVYHGMDIGTAKPSEQDRREIPHHGIDVAHLAEGFDAAAFISLADAATAAVQSRGRTPILCGGTGLYFKAWLEGLGEVPSTDPSLRRELQSASLATLLHELARLDPATHERIDRQNPRRVVRAVEVLRLSGKPLSTLQSVWGAEPASSPRSNPPFFYLHRDPEDLRRRIDQRVEAMFRAGWVAEVRRLMETGLESNRGALQAIGYRQIVEQLRGGSSLDETIEWVKIRTRQYARRQRIWFQKHARPHWLVVPAEEPPDVTRDRVLDLLRPRPR